MKPQFPNHRNLAERPHALFFGDQSESRTQQQFKDGADINKRIAKYKRTGFLVDPLKVRKRQAVFADVTNAEDFQTMQNKIIEIKNAFDWLPSNVRSRFKNDPRVLLEWLENPANLAEAKELGIIEGKTPERAQRKPSDDGVLPKGTDKKVSVPDKTDEVSKSKVSGATPVTS